MASQYNITVNDYDLVCTVTHYRPEIPPRTLNVWDADCPEDVYGSFHELEFHVDEALDVNGNPLSEEEIEELLLDAEYELLKEIKKGHKYN